MSYEITLFLSRTFIFDRQFISEVFPRSFLIIAPSTYLILNYLSVYSSRIVRDRSRVPGTDSKSGEAWDVRVGTFPATPLLSDLYRSFVDVVHYPFRCPSLLRNGRTTLGRDDEIGRNK